MSDDLKREETQTEIASRAESKRHSRCWLWVIAILGAVILGGAGAFLVFSPASPMHEWAQGVLWPPPEGTEQVNPQAQGQFVPEEEEEHCLTLTLHLVFSPGEGFDAPEVEIESSTDADIDAEAAAGEPSPADIYRAAMLEAVEELNGGTAKTSAIVITITPISYSPVEGASRPEPLSGYRTEEMAKRVKAAEEEAVAASFKPSAITVPPATMLSCVCCDPGVFDVSLEAPVVDSCGFVWELAGGPIRVELLDDQEVELLLMPVVLAALSAEEFAALKVVAGVYADALIGRRDAEIAVMLAGEVDEPEVEDPDNPEGLAPGNPGGAGNSGGSHSSGQNPGNGGSPSSGDGGGTETHTHTWEMRIVIIGSHEETEVVPAWDETIHHNAV